MQKLKINIGWIIVILLSIMPVIFWILIPKINSPLDSWQNIIISLGEIFGLVGIVIFSLNFILATRLPFIDKLFNGLNNVYKKHNLLGQLAIILLLFHPLLLLPRYAKDFKEAATFLLLSSSWNRNFGILALGIMFILIILTLYLRPKYNLWKITHKFFGLALFLGALHVYLIPSYILSNPVLNIYILTLAILGIISFIYRSVLGKFLVKTYTYTVKNIIHLNNDIYEITLKPNQSKLEFKAGQFIFISFHQSGIPSESHPFSISSDPNENLLKITVKKLGDYTKILAEKLQSNTIAKIEGPFGSFSYKNSSSKNQIWIAGGVGITPFISFIKDLKKEDNYFLTLFYCVKNEEEAIYLNLLREMETNLSNFSVIPFYSEKKGFINVKYIQQSIKNIHQKDIFICAPPKMIEGLKKGFKKIDINKYRIHSEEFNF